MFLENLNEDKITHVNEIMTKKVVLIDSVYPISRAAQMMAKFEMEMAVVMDETVPIGMLSSKDIMLKIVAKEKPLSTPTKKVMSSPMIEINQMASVWEAADLMTARNVKNLVVVDSEEKVVGTIHLLDVLKGISKTNFS